MRQRVLRFSIGAPMAVATGIAMMGMWFLFTAFANNLAALIAGLTTGHGDELAGVMAYGNGVKHIAVGHNTGQ